MILWLGFWLSILYSWGAFGINSLALWNGSNKEMHGLENVMYNLLWAGQKETTKHMVNLYKHWSSQRGKVE